MSENGDFMTITVAEWEAREKRLEKLDALEACGVDNWEGYSEAMRMLRGEDDGD